MNANVRPHVFGTNWEHLKSKSKIKHIAYTGGKQQVLHFASCGLMDVPSRIFRVKLEMILVKITYKTFCAVLLCIIFEIFAYILLSPDHNKMQFRNIAWAISGQRGNIYLILFHPLGVGPLGDYVVGDPLHQVLRHLVQRHELPVIILVCHIS